MRQNLFFNKVADLRPATLLKKRLWYRSFPVDYAKFQENTFFAEHFLATASAASKNQHQSDKFTEGK